jgi:hypothetical protein
VALCGDPELPDPSFSKWPLHLFHNLPVLSFPLVLMPAVSRYDIRDNDETDWGKKREKKEVNTEGNACGRARGSQSLQSEMITESYVAM